MKLLNTPFTIIKNAIADVKRKKKKKQNTKK